MHRNLRSCLLVALADSAGAYDTGADCTTCSGLKRVSAAIRRDLKIRR